MQPVTLLTSKALGLTIERLCHQLIEDHGDLGGVALVGLQPRGIHLARRLRKELARILGGEHLEYGELDITFHRDDFRHRATPPSPSITQLDFSLDERKVVLVDDVLYTGRTIRAALDALTDLGRPARIQLAVLVDRGHRELPIRADFVGKNVPTATSEDVAVRLSEVDGGDDSVVIIRGEA
jgi:pyrimidine operon attenuation protein/uracil phosphoribosyltransferase